MAKKRDPRDQQESLFSSPLMIVQERELSAEVLEEALEVFYQHLKGKKVV